MTRSASRDSEVASQRIRAARGIDKSGKQPVTNLPPKPPYTPEEEALLGILRRHSLVDPTFGDLWSSGRTSPADNVIVLAAYGVTTP